VPAILAIDGGHEEKTALRRPFRACQGEEVTINWNCDFCGKPCLKISPAGVIYCEKCRMSYGESIFDRLTEKPIPGTADGVIEQRE